MIVPFELIDNQARIWVYQASRLLNQSEINTASSLIQQFIEQWNSHGEPNVGAFTILHNQFIIIASDERQHSVSGCSIDKSVQVIRDLESQLDIQLLNKSNVAFLINDEVVTIPMLEIKASIAQGIVDANTLFFNNSITKKEEMSSSWIIEAGNGWIKRYFAAATA